MATERRIDPVTFELVKNGLAHLCDEMALTMSRAAYSPLLREVLDFSTALLTPEGEAIGQGRTQLIQMGLTMAALEAIKHKFGDDMHPGDVFILNDPYEGGSHLPDAYILKPIFVGGRLAAFAGAEAHLSDMGGRVPGSNASDSTEIYQEGLRIPPSHLFFRGKPNRTLWDIVEKNVRQPHRVIGDLRAMLAAIAVGERGFLRYVEQYGHGRLRFYLDEILDYTERLTRAEIAGWPDGEYCFDDAMDDDGFDPDPIPIRVKITVRGDEVDFDFAGTGRQVRGAFNCPFTTTRGFCHSAVRSAMSAQHLPRNAGFARPVRVSAPEGSILNPRPPAAVTARALTIYRSLDAVIGAMAQFVPQRMLAGDEGGNGMLTFAGKDADGRPWAVSETYRGAWGGRQDRDGVDGICGIVAPTANVPCEIIEQEYPLRIQRYGYVQDACGAGRFRGGLGLVRQYEFLADQTMVQVRSDRVKTRTYGLYGGKPGTHSSNVLNPGPIQRDLPSKFMITLNAGDVLRCQLASAGGWGNPLERDPDRVQRDVRDGKISAAFAGSEHGVAIDPKTLAVDQAATTELRMAQRAGLTTTDSG